MNIKQQLEQVIAYANMEAQTACVHHRPYAHLEEIASRLSAIVEQMPSASAEPVAWRSEDWMLIVQPAYKRLWPDATIPLYAAPQVADKGPWTPSDDGRHIQSEDFEHDVTLRVSGDFATDEDRIAYTKWLAAKLNAAPQLPDGMVLVPEVLLRQISKWLAESADPYDKAEYAINGLIAAAKEEGWSRTAR